MGEVMNQPQYVLSITHERVTCLGEQFVIILQFLQPILKNGIWYASDVETLTNKIKVEHLKTAIPKKIGTTEDLIAFSKGVDQFLSGVFLLMPKDYGEQLDIKYYTEDDPFRDLGDAILEIRTFDTSFFLVYSNDLQVIEALSKAFNGEIYSKDEDRTGQ